ncbi:MAG: 3-hydroxyacyl-CoA dehydrogenase NAD-binding domain-containing protein, partial [Terriglobia bacterium]
MRWTAQRAAVLGAGTMGARIAAHLANCGVPTVLLDLVPSALTADDKKKGLDLSAPAVRNRLARAGLEAARKTKPAAFFLDELADRVTIGNFEDHLDWVAQADWIIEAVAEDLAIKRDLLARVAPHCKPDAVISSNTSGLSIAAIAAGFPEEFRRRWLGTHFFNPPRYLHLVEIIPGPDTLPDVTAAVAKFANVRLGKGVVLAKDTPNFIANRIGAYCVCQAFRAMEDEGLSVDEADQLTGPALGWPKSATFGTLDLVGLDVFASVIRNLLVNAPDESSDVLRLPAFAEKMLARGVLGAKTGSGFYKRGKKSSGETEVLTIDPETLEYRPRRKRQFASLDLAQNLEDAGQRVRALLQSEDAAGRFVWKVLSRTLLYAASRIPEIADRVVDVDRAMRWGFGWELGPFELWDAIGLAESVQRMEQEGQAIPEPIGRMLASGAQRFYSRANGSTQYFDLGGAAYQTVDQPPGVLLLRGGQTTPPVMRQSSLQSGLQSGDASLRDLGDGVACVEFHSKMNTIGPGILAMVHTGLQELARNFDALAIGNQGANFSAGANLLLLLFEIQEQNWGEIDQMIRQFQQLNLAIKYSPKPVVAAPFGMTLGGGCELALAAPQIQAAAETYIGLVETGAGLVPAGGGAKEMLLRAMDALPAGAEPLPAVKELFKTISFATVSGSAAEARRLGFLRPSDGITMNPDRLLADAKHAALELAGGGYRPSHPGPRSDVRVLGQGG